EAHVEGLQRGCGACSQSGDLTPTGSAEPALRDFDPRASGQQLLELAVQVGRALQQVRRCVEPEGLLEACQILQHLLIVALATEQRVQHQSSTREGSEQGKTLLHRLTMGSTRANL